MNKDQKKINLDNLDVLIKKIFYELLNDNKLNGDKPISINIQFVENDDQDEVYEDLENIIVEDSYVYLTLYTPYNINELRFDIIEKENKLLIKSYNYLFYKEIFLDVGVIKNSLETTFKNNILEMKLKISK